MEIVFTLDAVGHLEWWKVSGNKKALKKIERLLVAILENPEQGIGKPEPLKYSLSGAWSRRITDEHRLVYARFEGIIKIISLKGHYE